MTALEDLAPDLRAVVPGEDGPVAIVALHWHGDAALEVFYQREDGTLGNALLLRDSEPDIRIVEARAFTFDADPEEVCLVSEAYRISLAHLFDPYLAARTSAIDPLPHQISAVYQEMLPRLPLRYVLADDPGAGKTVMAGLLIKEMQARGDLRRCLVVCPGSLAEQWQDELFGKFGLRFAIITNDALEAAASGNAFMEHDLCIARLDKLSRNEDVQKKLERASWDLVVVDEAHKMSATATGGEVRYTKRYKLGQLLGRTTENLLLMTATPHNGKPRDFQLFMALIDPDRFEGAAHADASPDVSDLMRRLVKEDLLTFDGRPLFPERRAYTVNYDLSPGEADLYEAVTAYVREEFNRADKLDGKRRASVGFALTTLQRRLASSPEAIYQSLRRRRERLEGRLADLRAGRVGLDGWACEDWDPDGYDEDDYTEEEGEEVLDAATTARTAAELEAELQTLRRLERQANDVRMSGQDRKWNELSALLQDEAGVFDEEGLREKLIVFTEYGDTLRYLQGRIGQLVGDPEAVVAIHGGMSRDARREAEARFKQDKRVRILIATDAAGEGINLQRAHLMINYDLPWNPNRLEQRFGRIHRIGQTEVCHLWNLVSAQTREGQVFARLLSKLETEKAALGGRVFNVLGSISFGERTLRDLLLEAVRYGDQPEVKERLEKTVDNAVSAEELRRILDERALTGDVVTTSEVASIREDMERAEARRMEPFYIESFFLAAMEALGGRVAEREPGRYEVPRVPGSVRTFAEGLGAKVLHDYERVCFEKDAVERPGAPVADLVCPGHPLLDALAGVLLKERGDLLKRGCLFIDDQDLSAGPRVLFYIESSLQDGTTLADGGRRCVQRSVRFVELGERGETCAAGYAPYLDYRAPTAAERAALADYCGQAAWLSGDLEARALDFAAEHIVPDELAAERVRRRVRADKAERAVRERLTAEVRYWDKRARELRAQERDGKTPRMPSQNARQRAEELDRRLTERLGVIERERSVSARPCRVVGCALVAPRRFVEGLLGLEAEPPAAVEARRRVEQAAMEAVMAVERELGFEPQDVSALNRGWDVESRPGDPARLSGAHLRFIEVKGRAAGARTVTVSRNEVLGALNNPETFILAVVEVGEAGTRTTYIRRPFRERLGAGQVSGTFDVARLREQGEVVLEREQTWR